MNPAMRILLGILVAALSVGMDGCGQVSPPSAEEGSGDSDSITSLTSPAAPTYSGPDGTCSAFNGVANTNVGVNFVSAGLNRSFILRLPPADATGLPVLFSWHGHVTNPSADPASLALPSDLIAVGREEQVILVAPYSLRHDYPSPTPLPGGIALPSLEWFYDQEPEGNPDLILLDDIIACLSSQYQVDLNRIWSTGFSAGGFMNTYLAMHRSNRLASVVVLSGGLNGEPYQTPERKIPVLVEWGGPNDQPGGFPFPDTSRDFAALLREDGNGSFVITCEGTQGHQPPSFSQIVWPFLRDHPWGIALEPYLDYPDNLPPDYTSSAVSPFVCSSH